MTPPIRQNPPLTRPEITRLITQMGDAIRADNIQSVRDGFFIADANSNRQIDTAAWLQDLAQLVTAGVTGEEQLQAQRQILLNLDRLVSNPGDRRTLSALIASNHTNNPLARPQDNQVLTSQDRWYLDNVRTTIDVSNRHQLAEQLLETGMAGIQSDRDGRLAGLSGWQVKARRMMHGAWNNDPKQNGQKIQFTSTKEYISMHSEAKGEARKEAERRGETFNEQAFNQRFNQIFMRSVREDTQFAPRLIASQASMALTRSRFTGEGSQECLACLQDLNTTLWQEVVTRGGQTNLPPGTILFTDKSSNPAAHGSMVVYVGPVGPDGQARIITEFTPPTQGVTFDFGGNGTGEASSASDLGGLGQLPPSRRLPLPPMTLAPPPSQAGALPHVTLTPYSMERWHSIDEAQHNIPEGQRLPTTIGPEQRVTITRPDGTVVVLRRGQPGQIGNIKIQLGTHGGIEYCRSGSEHNDVTHDDRFTINIDGTARMTFGV